MNKKISLVETSIYIVLLCCMIFICGRTTVEFFYEGKLNYFIFFAAILITLVFCAAVNYNRIALLALILVPFLPRPFYIVHLIKRIIDKFPSFVRDLYDSGYILSSYKDCFPGGAIICISLLAALCYLVCVIWKRSMVLIIAGACMYSTYFYYGEQNLELSCSLFMACGITLYAFNGYIKKKKYIYQNEALKRGSYVIGWLPSVAILMVVVMALSLAIQKPIKLKPIERIENLVYDITSGIEGPGRGTGNGTGYFSLSTTGFQNKKNRLGGSVKLNNSMAVIINSTDNISGTHMRGTVKDYYTGDVWKITGNKGKYNEADMLQYDDELINYSYYTEKKLDITHKINGIQTIFNALYPKRVYTGLDFIYIDDNMQLSSEGSIKREESYTLYINEYTWDKESLLNAQVDVSSENYKRYTALPHISDRVYKLTEDITKDYDKPYLKASAIEYYLKNTYPYSLRTSELPKNAEFVDYFLFKEKKGSCTYYATAMAVMCRISGIPSRYVEGFVVPSDQKGEGYEVRNSDAHAWVELYFDNLGWIPFDPTPGHQSGSINMGPESGENENPTSEPTPEEDDTPIKPTQSQQQHPGEGTTETEHKEEEGLNIPVQLWVGLGFVAAVFLLKLLLKRYYSKRNRRFFYSFFQLTRYGRTLYVPYRQGQSVREYLLGLEKATGVSMERLLEAYEICQYSDGTVAFDSLSNKVVNKIYKQVVEKKGRMKALWVRYTNPYVYIFKRK